MSARPRPLLVALLFGLAAECLFLWGLATPHVLVFDEIHYVRAARILIALDRPANAEHPLVAKEFIAAGILLFGDDSFGWRFFSTLAGSATVMAVFAILWLLFGRLRTAALGAAFAILNLTVYIQARIAMIDGYLAAFTLGAIAAMLWAMRAPPGRVWPRWLLSAVLFGLAVGAKWAAVPYVAGAGIAFLAVRLGEARAARRPVATMLGGRGQRYWPGLPALPALLAFGLVAMAVYFLTFLPAFLYHRDAMTAGGLLPFQVEMYRLQTQVLPHHIYQSRWWSWPLILRPIWYFYQNADGAMRGVFMAGNPVVLWGGLAAVVACLWSWWRDRDVRMAFVALLWAASWLVWAITPKSLGFFYYYYLPSIFLCVALAAAFGRYARGRLAHADEAFLVLAFGVAVYFFPIVSAAALPNARAFEHWMWFASWV